MTIDLKKGLEIDKLALDDEVIRQPMLFYAVSEQLTEALAERDAAKEELATTDAELYLKYRKKLAVGEKVRVTDTMVATYVQQDPLHEKAFLAHLEAKTKADKLQGLKDAFSQRAYMLRDLVSLYSANYYETTTIKPTHAQEASHYNANRARIANSRAAKAGQ